MNNFRPDPKPGKKKRKKAEHQLGGKALLDRYREVVERDGARCKNLFCECPNPYLIDYPHHIKKKSAGRDDRAENLITLGVHCHRKVHDEWLKVSGTYPNVYFHWVEEPKIF